jgi:hypothetical protein
MLKNVITKIWYSSRRVYLLFLFKFWQVTYWVKHSARPSRHFPLTWGKGRPLTELLILARFAFGGTRILTVFPDCTKQLFRVRKFRRWECWSHRRRRRPQPVVIIFPLLIQWECLCCLYVLSLATCFISSVPSHTYFLPSSHFVVLPLYWLVASPNRDLVEIGHVVYVAKLQDWVQGSCGTDCFSYLSVVFSYHFKLFSAPRLDAILQHLPSRENDNLFHQHLVEIGQQPSHTLSLHRVLKQSLHYTVPSFLCGRLEISARPLFTGSCRRNGSNSVVLAVVKLAEAVS